MKRACLLLALLLCPVMLQARQRAQGFCEQGGLPVITQGLTSTTNAQRSYPGGFAGGCTVTVFYAVSGLQVAGTDIYSDNAGTIKGNPFNADANGYWFFYADNGRYNVQFSGTGITTFAHGDYLLNDYWLTGACDASAQIGADEGVKVAVCRDLLPAAGGTVDARGLVGPQAISVDMFASTPKVIRLLMAPGPHSVSAVQTIRAHGTSIIGTSPGDAILVPTMGTIFKWTGAAKGLLFDAQNSNNLRFEDFTIDPNGLLTRAFQFGGAAGYTANTYGLRMTGIKIASAGVVDDTFVVPNTGLRRCAVELYGPTGSLQDSMFIDSAFFGATCGIDSGVGDNSFIRSQFSADGSTAAGFVMGVPSGSIHFYNGLFTVAAGGGTHIGYAAPTGPFGDVTVTGGWFEGGNATGANNVVLLRRVDGVAGPDQVNGAVIEGARFATDSVATNAIDLTGLLMNQITLRQILTTPGDDVNIVGTTGSLVRIEEQLGGPGFTHSGTANVAYFQGSQVTLANGAGVVTGQLSSQNNAGTGTIGLVRRTQGADAVQVAWEPRVLAIGSPATLVGAAVGDAVVATAKCYRSAGNAGGATFQMLCSDAADNAVVGGNAAGIILGVATVPAATGQHFGSVGARWDSFERNLGVKRIWADGGTPLVAGDFALHANWGDTPAASISAVVGTDQATTFTVSAGTANFGANPTVILTFKDLTWNNNPICVANRGDATAPTTGFATVATAATTMTLTFQGTPGAGTYSFNVLCMGR